VDSEMSGLAIFYAEVDFINPGLVFDEEVADEQPSVCTVNAPELGTDQIGAFGRERVNGLSSMSEAADKEAAQEASPGELQQARNWLGGSNQNQR